MGDQEQPPAQDQWDQLYPFIGKMLIDDYQVGLLPPFLDLTAKEAIAQAFNQACFSDAWTPTYPSNASPAQKACLMGAFQAGKSAKSHMIVDQNRPPPQMKEPKVDFYEGDQSKFQNFTYEIAALFAACPGVYLGKEQAKMLAIFTRLRGAAQAWARPHMNKTTAQIDFKDSEAFLKALGDAFDDPDQIATAERQIFNLRQTGNVSSYHSEFVTYATRLGWTEGSFPIALFHKGLSDHLKDVIATHIHSAPKDSLDKYANWVMALDNSLTARREEKKSSFSFNSKSSSHPAPKGPPTFQSKQNSFPTFQPSKQSGWLSSNQPRQQSWSFSKPPAPPQNHQRAASTPHFNKGDPMEVDAISLPFKYQNGKKGAIAVGICWKCGKNHHMKQCPQYKPQAHAMQTSFGSFSQMHYPQNAWFSYGQPTWGPPQAAPSAPSAPAVQQVQTAPKPPAQQSAAPPSKN